MAPLFRFFACLLFLTALPAAPTNAATSLIDDLVRALQGGGSVSAPPPTSSEIAFSPDGGATDLIVKAIGTAKKSIRVTAYSFTSRPIAKALILAHRAGVDVAVIVDHGQIPKSSHSIAPSLAAAGIPVRADIVHAIQHNKYMVIDDKTVETGSFNYSSAAEHKNAENVIVLWDTPALAAAYAQNWEKLWEMAEPYKEQ